MSLRKRDLEMFGRARSFSDASTGERFAIEYVEDRRTWIVTSGDDHFAIHSDHLSSGEGSLGLQFDEAKREGVHRLRWRQKEKAFHEFAEAKSKVEQQIKHEESMREMEDVPGWGSF